MAQPKAQPLRRAAGAVVVATLLCFAPGIGLSQTAGPARPSAPTPADVARAVVNLLSQACASSIGSAEGLERVARTNNFAPARPETAPVFARFGGAAWVWQRQDVDLALVWTADALQCRVVARNADFETARTYFRSVMDGVRHPGVSVSKEMDGEREQDGTRFHQIAYLLQDTLNPVNAARAFFLTTFPAPDAPFAVIATVAATQRR